MAKAKLIQIRVKGRGEIHVFRGNREHILYSIECERKAMRKQLGKSYQVLELDFS